MSTATAEQLELDILGRGPVVEPTYARGASWAEKFEQFHATNPHVARALEALAGQWLAFHAKVSVKALFERLRWEYGIQTRGEAMRLNTSVTAYYARLLIERRPEWVDAIDTRQSQADHAPDG
jgi:hypothetical protein